MKVGLSNAVASTSKVKVETVANLKDNDFGPMGVLYDPDTNSMSIDFSGNPHAYQNMLARRRIWDENRRRNLAERRRLQEILTPRPEPAEEMKPPEA